jgi:sRNA-binding carbon storage regulator CsrA
MLVLSRKVDEWIDLPSLGVSVLVCRLPASNRVVLGVCAPDEHRIYRRELLEKLRDGTSDKESTHRHFSQSKDTSQGARLEQGRVQGKRIDRTDGAQPDGQSDGRGGAGGISLPSGGRARCETCGRPVLEQPVPDRGRGTGVPG